MAGSRAPPLREFLPQGSPPFFEECVVVFLKGHRYVAHEVCRSHDSGIHTCTSSSCILLLGAAAEHIHKHFNRTDILEPRICLRN